jgi:hypothetical protein
LIVGDSEYKLHKPRFIDMKEAEKIYLEITNDGRLVYKTIIVGRNIYGVIKKWSYCSG